MSEGKVVHAVPGSHSSDPHHHGVESQIRTYLVIFAALTLLTMVTVGVSYLHLPRSSSIVVALLIAVAKATLIALFFMHLVHEGGLIKWSVAICLALVLVLIVFVIPDIGVSPVEEVERAAQHDAIKFFHNLAAEAGHATGGGH
jgi:cytochrome c oxidase subunit 4